MAPPYSRRRLLASVGVAASASVAGCADEASPPEEVDSAYDLSVRHDIDAWDGYDPEWLPPETPPTEATFETETLVDDLEIPWDVAFATADEFFISERVGRIGHYSGGELEAVIEPDSVIDHASSLESGHDWWGGGSEGGLLGTALHPNYPDIPVLYAAYTYGAGGETYRNRVVYFDLENGYEETVVVDGIPGHRLIHNGARLAFGPRNYLWLTTGDADLTEQSADPNSLAGTVLRLEPDGTAPGDGPTLGDPRVHTYGHRNPQGIAWLPDGTPVATEHGPASRDEINVLEAGTNYGWPSVRGVPDDAEHDTYAEESGVASPLVHTGTEETWAPSGCVFYTGEAVPALRNRLLVGCLASQRLTAVSIYRSTAPDIGGSRYDADWFGSSYEAVSHSLLEDDLGRIRHVTQGPEGELYALTSNRDGRSDQPTEDAFPQASDDRLVRIVQSG